MALPDTRKLTAEPGRTLRTARGPGGLAARRSTPSSDQAASRRTSASHLRSVCRRLVSPRGHTCGCRVAALLDSTRGAGECGDDTASEDLVAAPGRLWRCPLVTPEQERADAAGDLDQVFQLGDRLVGSADHRGPGV